MEPGLASVFHWGWARAQNLPILNSTEERDLERKERDGWRPQLSMGLGLLPERTLGSSPCFITNI